MSWRKVKLGDIAYINQNTINKNFGYSEIEYIDISSVGTGTLASTTKLKLSEAPSRAKRLVKDEDTILSTVRPNRRSFLYINKSRPNLVVSTGFAVLSAFEGYHPKFIYYLINDQKLTDYLTNSAKGAAYPAVDTEIIFNAEVSVPNFETQTKIASILSAYDDLIENNTRRIKILEEMAQTIYKEWFVKFRIPNCELRITDEGIPEGWEVRTVFDCVEVFSGGTPKTSVGNYWNGKIPFYTPRDSSNEFWILNTEKLLTEEGLRNCNSKLYPKHTVFITARGTVGKMNINDEPMTINQSCYALIGKNHVPQFYVFFALLNYVSHMKQIATGGVFDTIIVDTFKVIPFLLPSDFILDVFDKNISPLLNETLLLAKKNQNLRRTRDLLLPKLMSGEVEV